MCIHLFVCLYLYSYIHTKFIPQYWYDEPRPALTLSNLSQLSLYFYFYFFLCYNHFFFFRSFNFVTIHRYIYKPIFIYIFFRLLFFHVSVETLLWWLIRPICMYFTWLMPRDLFPMDTEYHLCSKAICNIHDNTNIFLFFIIIILSFSLSLFLFLFLFCVTVVFTGWMLDYQYVINIKHEFHSVTRHGYFEIIFNGKKNNLIIFFYSFNYCLHFKEFYLIK